MLKILHIHIEQLELKRYLYSHIHIHVPVFQILVAGLGLPWLGYFFGWLLSHVFKQPPDDTLAISIETGIQNTGIAIFLLRFSLEQPEADLTTG